MVCLQCECLYSSLVKTRNVIVNYVEVDDLSLELLIVLFVERLCHRHPQIQSNGQFIVLTRYLCEANQLQRYH